MEIIRSLEELPAQPPCSLALGAFDGLHRGHMAVIRAAISSPFQPAIFTFSHSPSGDQAVLTPQDKAALLERAGMAAVYSLDFPALRNWTAESFVQEILFEKLHAKRLCCGEDFRFGRGALGNVALLKKLCAEKGVDLEVVPPVLDGGEKVSSTRIRHAVEAGDIPLANRLLGRPFGFSQEVIHGNHIGSTKLGTPTINQALPEDFVLPRFGVYAAWCQTAGRYYYGVCNVGVKPTVGSDRVLAETWMPDFSGDLYGRQVRLFLLEFIRPEKKFSSLDELREEIRRNGREAKAIAGAWGLPGEYIF
ncbi:riboflavin biosynthesis protein RibF [Acutalibacter sp. 1XD8-33]|uniref:riboflavin biosynthesis protein RibF n=1 Tax=Acutalibacter sp. 1XD8-33 TaxID=2320081 RepID=UPI000EA32EB2|nr:riboflavin biosynthesis protein RibF [Acutalibacter sp. 1XD8-33]RKJ41675.1 riboflavin biosynthesis protein RibF [Acutalibacter sp. 1XD8-33]